MKRNVIYLFLATFALFLGCRPESRVDPLLRSKADGLNKEAFICRFRDPDRCIALSQLVIDFVADSLPEYDDGVLRAMNDMAFAYFQQARYQEATQLVDKIAAAKPDSPNGDIEVVISRLLKARLLQRECRIADSYRILHDVERSGVLEHNRQNMLYNYAKSEYYITMLTLNYHYRNGRQADVRMLLGEVEAERDGLKVDYAEDLALNYAIAYGWQSAGESDVALDYCDMNLSLLDMPEIFCPFHYANTLQMYASALKSRPGGAVPDSVLALYDEARQVFFEYGDPYQMLGGTVSTARYALLTGDTLKAHEVLGEWRELHGLWKPFTAPKMEEGYFDVLIRSCYAQTADENRLWYEHRCELQDYISQNQTEDFALQQSLAMANRRSRWMGIFAFTLGTLLLALLVLLIFLIRNTMRLRAEKRQLEESKRRDVERIANVETTLSVLRHDVSPFMGYLNNPNLSEELRKEVLSQLVRTFDNIKNWTRLSIPGGLTFTGGDVALQEVFDDVRQQIISPEKGVELTFEPCDLTVWGDRLLLTILLRNLINNALQHTSHGSVTISAQEADEGMVDIAVKDTGTGMTSEQKVSLFKADRTLEAGSEHGFGLILCRYIIKKHDDNTRRGCKIWVESEIGHGTTIFIRLSGSEHARLKEISYAEH